MLQDEGRARATRISGSRPGMLYQSPADGLSAAAASCPMTLYRMQTTLSDTNGLSRDQYVTTMHIWSGSGGDLASTDATPAQLAAWAARVQTFHAALRTYYSIVVANPINTIKVYDVSAPLESPPVYTQALAFGGAVGQVAGSIPLPNEVAACLTYHADFQAGVPRQSWRGRQYLGPLSSVAAGLNDQAGRPSSALRADAVAAAQAMGAGIAADEGQWSHPPPAPTAHLLSAFVRYEPIAVAPAMDSGRRLVRRHRKPNVHQGCDGVGLCGTVSTASPSWWVEVLRTSQR
jgi:hypothetical protein